MWQPCFRIKAFFSNSVCDLFAEPIEKASCGLPFALCQEILLEYKRAEQDDDMLLKIPELLCTSMDQMLLACKAVVAVSSPVPGHYGSSYHDVVAVFFPEQLTEDDPAQENIEQFRDLQTAAMKNTAWKARLHSYLTLGLEDTAVRDEHDLLVESLGGDSIDIATVNLAIGKCKDWGKKLRSGGLIFDKLGAWAKRIEASDAETCRAVMTIAISVDPWQRD